VRGGLSSDTGTTGEGTPTPLLRVGAVHAPAEWGMPDVIAELDDAPRNSADAIIADGAPERCR